MSTEPQERIGPRTKGPKQSAWSFAEFTSEIGKARRIGPANLSNAELLGVCASAQGYIKTHFLADARPFFVELWKRIEEKRFSEAPTKKEACRLIGCSQRWAQLIVAGAARKKTKHEATGNAAHYDAATRSFERRTNQEYVADIRSYAEKKLQTLWVRGEFSRCKNIYGLLEKHFADAACIDHIDDLNRERDSVPLEQAAL